MGIKGLNPFIKKINKDVFKSVDIKTLKGKSFAVDISIFINTYAMSSQEFWFIQMTNFLLSLVKNGLNPIIVFDGLNVPEEKLVEREDRKSSKQKNKAREEKIAMFKEKLIMKCWNDEEAKIVPDELIDEFKALFKLKNDVNPRDAEEVLLFVTEKLVKVEQQAIGINNDHKTMTRSLVKAMGLPYIQADGEAEALCSSMAFNGVVDGVISRDTDTLAYGCPFLLKEIKKGIAEIVYLKDVLDALELSKQEFVNMCICFGCDYNKNMPGIGPAKVYPAIKKHKSIKEWKEDSPELPFHILKWKRCLEIFRPYSKSYITDKCQIKKRPFDPVVLDKLFTETNSRYTSDFVKGVLEGKIDKTFQGKDLSILDDFE